MLKGGDVGGWHVRPVSSHSHPFQLVLVLICGKIIKIKQLILYF